LYEKFFGLREAPFNDNPDPRYLYLTPSIRKALEDLTSGIQSHQGCILLTGEVGTGKTTLLNFLLDWLQQRKTTTAFVFNCRLSANSLLEFILSDFGIPFDVRLKGNMLLSLTDWLLERYRAGETPVLIVDEAQGLPIELLEELRLLLNIETPSRKLLQIVLAGQPELDEKLLRPELRQFRQRINLRCKTAPLTCEEAHHYIHERLRTAGASELPIFEPDAMDAAYMYSRGIPRVLNLLCQQALISAYVDNVCPVPASLVEQAAREFVLDEVANPASRVAPAAPVLPSSPHLPSSRPRVAEPRTPFYPPPGVVHSSPQESAGHLASRVPLAYIGESPVLAKNNASPVSPVPDPQASMFLKQLAESLAALQIKQKERTPGPVIVPSEPQLSAEAIPQRSNHVPPPSFAPRPVPTKTAFSPLIPKRAAPSPAPASAAMTAGPSLKIDVLHSSSSLMANWQRSLDHWWSKNLSQQLLWKTFVSTGLTGSILFILAGQMSPVGPGSHLARLSCGFLGFLLGAVSLSCGASLLIDLTRTQPPRAARWSRPFVSVARWMRKPVDL
jgi:general secretion pathway protein A